MALPTRDLSDFLHIALPFARQCPEPVVEQMLRFAAIDFCERTRCWRHITTQALTGQGPAVVAPVYATIHEFETAYHEGCELTPTQFSDVAHDHLTDVSGGGTPRYITQVSPNTVSIYPYADGDLRLTLFLKPRFGQSFGQDSADPMHDSYNVVPEFLFIQHAETIAHGALARIKKIPEQSYTDYAEAANHAAEFERQVSAKFVSNIRGQQRAPVRVTPQFM